MTQPGAKNTHPALVSYPAKAAFGRTLPKNKIYEHTKANTRLKGLFVKEVEQIVWQYKLAPETINLPARPDVPEIQVFTLQLKKPKLNRDVLRALRFCADEADVPHVLSRLVGKLARRGKGNEADVDAQPLGQRPCHVRRHAHGVPGVVAARDEEKVADVDALAKVALGRELRQKRGRDVR